MHWPIATRSARRYTKFAFKKGIHPAALSYNRHQTQFRSSDRNKLYRSRKKCSRQIEPIDSSDLDSRNANWFIRGSAIKRYSLCDTTFTGSMSASFSLPILCWSQFNHATTEISRFHWWREGVRDVRLQLSRNVFLCRIFHIVSYI